MCLNIRGFRFFEINFLAPESHIRTHAYHLWENAGRPHDRFFWHEAEKECDYILGYKVVHVTNNMVTSPIYAHIWRDGWNDSGRESTQLTKHEIEESSIFEGFHVYFDPEEAHQSCTKSFIKIMQVHCHKNDFIASGVYDNYDINSIRNSCKAAVFTKVFVPPHAIDSLLKCA